MNTLSPSCFLSALFGSLRTGAVLLFAAASTGGSTGFAAADYVKSVKPLLQERCYACHGALKQKGGLRLDTAVSIRKGGDSGAAVAPGYPEKSLLVGRVLSSDPDDHMPPRHEGEPLNASQVRMLQEWISAGAPAPGGEQPEPDPRDHWAFRPPVRPPVPSLENREWAANPIDAFISARHAGKGLLPQARAPRGILVRRLFIDLVGVPPSLDETAVINAMPDSEWYPALVEKLLADPRHGQRWARHWMDVWRYSDWWGLGEQLRNSQKHIWHWRDWIIESLNNDAPYDEMVRLMLAADEIAPEDASKLRATGFLARNWFLFNRNTWMEDTVEHVGKGLLGLTFNCSKCHDHKYDPISQTDFYRLRAVFEPYHVRIDVTAGGADLGKDGIPRAFDADARAVTYRFVRGEESQPDKSAVISPGVPAVFDFAKLDVVPIELPLAAYEPQRQPWVLEAHVATAAKSLEAAAEALKKAAEKFAKAKEVAQKDSGSEPLAKAVLESEAEWSLAEKTHQFTGAEKRSVEARATAMRALWRADSNEQSLRAAAVAAERKSAAARQDKVVADARLKLLRAPEPKKPDLEKKLAAALEESAVLAKAVAAEVKTADSYTVLFGAKWTPTRFLSSGKDDPEPAFPQQSSGRRTALARWITDPRNPLTARVAVNHIWTRHMGVPLAAGMFEFGRKGATPSHPELLDWLAAELVEHGWSMKHLHRLIVNSQTYRMGSSAAGAEVSVSKDPDNVEYWRRAPVRLESGVIRDSLLGLSGSLDCSMGGPPIEAATQEDSARRSVYFYHSNNSRNLFLTMFDEAPVKECYRREQSVVPQQAMAMTNSRLVEESARRIARLVSQRCAGTLDDEGFVRAAYEYVLGVPPQAEELAACMEALLALRGASGTTESAAGTGSQDGAQTEARAQLVWVLLNHNDFVTLR
jgi:hypothetical protein